MAHHKWAKKENMKRNGKKKNEKLLVKSPVGFWKYRKKKQRNNNSDRVSHQVHNKII